MKVALRSSVYSSIRFLVIAAVIPMQKLNYFT